GGRARGGGRRRRERGTDRGLRLFVAGRASCEGDGQRERRSAHDQATPAHGRRFNHPTDRLAPPGRRRSITLPVV
ncbi:MAG: hypothetical protein AVDCRST_MAG10-1690, partial [uncultured Acidimicrobiales bacterium]